MPLDLVDEAFLLQWRNGPAPAPAPRLLPADVPSAPAAAAPPMPADAQVDDLVARLIASAAGQWQSLATEVEAARRRGRRVIAVTGREPGEGRSTVVEGLCRVLRQRGRAVVQCDRGTLADVGGATHDPAIVVVDAGIWFPPGPIRRQRLLLSSVGCDAAILVRRADSRPIPALGAALEALGIEPLGEVLTFAAAPDAAATGEEQP